MLIESDKRGVELQLLYADEQFSIPSNVYIIGMMNTADRSLAMLDYALRRRFAFFELAPAFSSAGFRAYRTKVNNPKFDRLIATVEQLNDVIANDDSLGEGFCIGHSYFCTNATINDEWMRSVVEYELIPLLKEYWFDEAVKVKDWSRTLRELRRAETHDEIFIAITLMKLNHFHTVGVLFSHDRKCQSLCCEGFSHARCALQNYILFG